MPSTDLRGCVQNTLYICWCQQNADIERCGQHKRLEMLMPTNWRSPTTTAMSRDLVELVQTHSQKKVGRKGKGKGVPMTSSSSSSPLSDDGLVVDSQWVEPPMKSKKEVFATIRKDQEDTTCPDQERPPTVSLFAEGFMAKESEGVYAAGTAAEQLSTGRCDLPACVGSP